MQRLWLARQVDLCLEQVPRVRAVVAERAEIDAAQPGLGARDRITTDNRALNETIGSGIGRKIIAREEGGSNAEGTNTSQQARLYVTLTNAVSTPIAMTGWNRDVILENAATPFAQSFDTATNFTAYGVWFEEGLAGNLNGLPSSRQFASAIKQPDVVFEFQPYNTNNVLWMTTSRASQRTNTLTLVSPKPYVSLSIAAASGYRDQSAGSTLSVSGYPNWRTGKLRPVVNRTCTHGQGFN